MTETRVDLSIPRFKAEWGSKDISPILKVLGITDAFSEAKADFSKINGAPAGTDSSLFIAKVFHKAKIEVDEKGSEAAAATAIAMVAGGAMPRKQADPIVLKADRPFYYAIIDTQTGLILFNGVYNAF